MSIFFHYLFYFIITNLNNLLIKTSKQLQMVLEYTKIARLDFITILPLWIIILFAISFKSCRISRGATGRAITSFLQLYFSSIHLVDASIVASYRYTIIDCIFFSNIINVTFTAAQISFTTFINSRHNVCPECIPSINTIIKKQVQTIDSNRSNM